MSKTYENFTDEELIRKLRGGEEDIMDYLLNKYKNLVKAQAGSYFIPGADEQDILQEGMILRQFVTSRMEKMHAFPPLQDFVFPETFRPPSIRQTARSRSL